MFCNQCNDWKETITSSRDRIVCSKCFAILALTRQPRFGKQKAKQPTDGQTTKPIPGQEGIQSKTETKLRSEAEPAGAPNVFDKLARGRELRAPVPKQSKRKQREREQIIVVVGRKARRAKSKRSKG